MVLRLTMEEFRKIPSNDKILFGILIAVIVFNSMIPRVVEGNTPASGSFFNVLTPVIRSAQGSANPQINQNVVSISGVFRLSAAITIAAGASSTLTVKFPPNYFSIITSPATPITNTRIRISRGGNILHTFTAATAVLDSGASADTVINFTVPGGTTILVSGSSDLDYTFVIDSTTNTGSTLNPIFKFGPNAIGMANNGFKIGATGFTEGSARTQALYADATAASGQGSSSAATMASRSNEIINNINNLQNIETALFNKLSTDTSLDPASRSEIVNQINLLAKARGDLYNNMNDFSSQIETVAGERRNALVQNSVAVSVIKDQIENSKQTLTGLEEDKSNKMRLVEINSYYGKKYEFQTEIMKIIILTCVPVLIISILLKKGFIPNMIATGLIIIVIAVGLIVTGHKVIDLNKRNKFNFDQYDHPFNPYAVQVSKTENTNLSDINKMSFATSCLGPSCCTDGQTKWDEATKKCIGISASSGSSSSGSSSSGSSSSGSSSSSSSSS